MDSAPLPVSSVTSLVNDGSPTHHILLVATHDGHERDLLEALRDGAKRGSDFPYDLVYFDLRHAIDFIVVFSLLDRPRSGYFSAVHLVSPASTWSRVRHSSVPGQPPAPSQQQKVVQSISEVEASCWFLEQALRYVGKQVQVLLVFPEDFGGSKSDGPATIWDSFEVRSLSGLSGAHRGSAFMCELTGADHRGPLVIFTNIRPLKARMYPGWPLLHLQGNTELSYKGPLPPSCPCLPAHPRRRGLNVREEFHSSSSFAFGKEFW